MFSILPTCAQNRLTEILGNIDQGVVMPQPIVALGRQDPVALQEIQAYRKSVNVAVWTDMKGTGEFTPSAPNSNVESATLWLLGHNGYRLDIEKNQGRRSIRTQDFYGAVQHAGGQIEPIDVRDAIKPPIAFSLVDGAGFPGANVTLIDQGDVTVDGASLHRISVAIPWPGNPIDAKGNPRTSVTDLYFDPKTHLLMKSANSILGSNPTPERYLRVMTYGDYRAVRGMLVPYNYEETLNGQALWTLQLQQMHLDNGISDSDFHF
jgi:hypothetical protein